MRVKPTNPEHAVGLIDPHTKRRPFIDAETGRVLESAEVPETVFWNRRLRAGEIVRVANVAAQPAGGEPAPTLKRAEK